MGNHISDELTSSFGTEFVSQLDPQSRCKALAKDAGLRVGAQFAMSSKELRVAVESAREAGACVVQRAVRMNREGQAEVRELWSEEWRVLGSLRASRQLFMFSFTCAGSASYLIGGIGAEFKVFDSVEVLDTVTGTWSTAPPLATARYNHSCMLVGELLYMIGGYGGRGWLDSVEVLDTVTGTWSTAAPMPTVRYDHSCTLVGELLYVIGGIGAGWNDSDSVEVLDTVTGTWSTAAPLATARHHHSCALVGELLYVIGGRGADDKVSDSVEVLDTTTGTWSTVAPMPTARSYHSCSLVGKLLYVIGGTGALNKLLDSVEVLDTVIGTWSTLEPDAIPSVAVAERRGEVLCEYTKPPSAPQAAKEKSQG